MGVLLTRKRPHHVTRLFSGKLEFMSEIKFARKKTEDKDALRIGASLPTWTARPCRRNIVRRLLLGLRRWHGTIPTQRTGRNVRTQGNVRMGGRKLGHACPYISVLSLWCESEQGCASGTCSQAGVSSVARARAAGQSEVPKCAEGRAARLRVHIHVVAAGVDGGMRKRYTSECAR
jgi:hypothetical protein